MEDVDNLVARSTFSILVILYRLIEVIILVLEYVRDFARIRLTSMYLNLKSVSYES